MGETMPDQPTERTIECPECDRKFATHDARRHHQRAKHGGGELHDVDTEPDYDGECENCGASPVVPLTGLCGPCTFGEADTMGGNW